jgi:hypothetical protein
MSEANQSPTFSSSMVVVTLAVLLLFAGLAWYLAAQRQPLPPTDKERQEQRVKNLADLAAENQKTLTSYRWIDKAKGIVGIPIDRAMELELADLAGKHPHAAGPITQPTASPAPSASGSPAQKPGGSPSPANNQPSPSPTAAAPSGTPGKS